MTPLALVFLASAVPGGLTAPAASVADQRPQPLPLGSGPEHASKGEQAALGSAATALLKEVLGPVRRVKVETGCRNQSQWSSLHLVSEALCDIANTDFSPFGLVEASAAGRGHLQAPVDDEDEQEDIFQLPEEGEVVDLPSAWQWWVLALISLAFVVLEYVVARNVPETTFLQLVSVMLWIVAAGFIFWYVQASSKGKHAYDWLTGYLLEWMLSLDNLFVFHLVVNFYGVPKAQLRKAVFMGIGGAVIMRVLFFFVLAELLQKMLWVRVPFGLLLIWSGVEAVRSEDDDVDLEDSRLVRLMRGCFGSRLHEGYDEEGHGVFVMKDGRLQVTMLFVVIVLLELADIMFAVDSVTAKLAAVPDLYLAFSSTLPALFGLRAAFFLLEDLVESFETLKYGLCLILVFIGMNLILSPWEAALISSSEYFIVIISIFFLSIAGACVMGGSRETALLPSKPDFEVAEEDASGKTAAP